MQYHKTDSISHSEHYSEESTVFAIIQTTPHCPSDSLPEAEELPVEVALDESEELDEVEEDLDLCRLFLRLLSPSAE